MEINKQVDVLNEKIGRLERCMYGEQINGNRIIGTFEKTEKMYEQFIFMFRLYKVLMVFVSATALGIIAILIKLFMGV